VEDEDFFFMTGGKIDTFVYGPLTNKNYYAKIENKFDLKKYKANLKLKLIDINHDLNTTTDTYDNVNPTSYKGTHMEGPEEGSLIRGRDLLKQLILMG
jgi:hypothetical protein